MRKALLLFAVFCAWAHPLGTGLRGYDDAYYARKALEVVRSGNWLGLPLGGSPTFDNPPLGIWTESVAFLLFGASDWAAKLPSAVYGVLTVLVFYAWVRGRFLKEETAFVSAAGLLCNILYIKYLRRGMVDPGCLFWSVLGVWLADRKPLSKAAQTASGIAFGLAFLTKSALALTVPVALALGWLWEGGEGRWRLKSWLPWSLLGFAGVAGGWMGVMAWRFGDPFWRGHFVWLLWEHGVRGTADSSRLQTLGGLFVALLPTSLVALLTLPALIRESASGSPAPRLALSWTLLPTAVLLAVGSRKLWYFMPSIPGLALVAGLGAARWMDGKPRAWPALYRGVLGVWIMVVALALVWPTGGSPDRTADMRALAAEARERVEVGAPVRLWFPGQECRWDWRNEFLWYADRPVSACGPEPPGNEAPGGPGSEWILTTREGEQRLRSAGELVETWFGRGDRVLMSWRRR